MWYNKIHGRPIQCGTIKYMADLYNAGADSGGGGGGGAHPARAPP